MTAGRSIDYDALTQEALRGLVRSVLEQIAKSGLPGEHHFYIAFDTQAPGVGLSRRLKEKYPDEMMIVLQHRFWDLAVNADFFEVKLTFDGIPERLVIPFQAMRVFFDPSVRFKLQFGDAGAQEDGRDVAPKRRRRDGAGDADAARRGGDARPGPRGVVRDEPEGDGAHDETASQPPAVAQPPKPPQVVPSGGGPSRPVEVFPRPIAVPPAPIAPAAAGASTAVSPAATPTGEPADTPAPAGAKVFSLDQFRKK